MTARKLHGSWWVDFRWKGARYRYKSPANTAQGAKDYEQVLRGRLARGEPALPPSERTVPTFEEFAREWFATYARTNNKPSEQKMKTSILRHHLVPVFGRRRLTQIAAADIEAYKARKLAAGYSPKTINNHLTVLRCSLQSAQDDGRLPTLPRIVWLEYTAPPADFLTIQESNLLLEAAPVPLWRTMILLALRTGMRFGELTALQWTDIDFEASIVTVRRSIVDGIVTTPKTHKIRKLPLATSAAEALRALPCREGPIFQLRPGGAISHDAATRALHRACQRAGLRAIGWHTLRHSCASQLGKLRRNLLEAQRILGHSSLAMTEEYTHFVPEGLFEAVASLDEAARELSVGTGWSTPALTESHREMSVVRNFSQQSTNTAESSCV